MQVNGKNGYEWETCWTNVLQDKQGKFSCMLKFIIQKNQQICSSSDRIVVTD